MVKLPYLAVEVGAQDLEPVGLALVADGGAAETTGRIEVEQDGQVRADGAASEQIGGFDERAVEPAAARLIGDRGVNETVAEDDLTGSQGRRDDIGDELRAASREQQGLGGRADDGAGMLEDVPHLLAERRATRFAEAQHARAGSAETVRQTGQLRGLSRAFPSFERDEFTGDRHAPSRCPPKGSKRAEKPSANKKARHQPGLSEGSEPRLRHPSAWD